MPLGGSLEADFVRRADGATLVARASRSRLSRAPHRSADRMGDARPGPHARRQARRRAATGAASATARRCASARAIAQALLDRDLSAERPLAILSDNDIEHPLLALGAMHAGVPFAPVSPAYSLVSHDYGKLRHILGMLTPGLVFASGAGVRQGDRGGRAARDAGRARRRRARRARVTPFAELLATAPTAGGRRRPRARRPRHDRQVPVHLGLDQAAQGRDQHAAHAVREPADDPPVLPVAGRGAAGAGRLAAVEPHLRRQPQRRPRRSTTAARSTSTKASRRRR